MNKKLMAVAVAGALAAPGVAFAQASSVTISGIFKVGVENLRHSGSRDPSTRLNSSQWRVVDSSSRILFNMVEGLGGGLEAIAQLDVRFAPDQQSTLVGGAPNLGNPIGSGNTWVGVRSNTLGMLTVGRWDLHYGKQPDDTAAKAGALEAAAISLMDFIGPTPIANATRTQNVVKWDSPNWGGFAGTVAWSANPTNGSELDMLNVTAAGTGTAIAVGQGVIPGTVITGTAGATSPVLGTTSNRRGNAWNLNPSYTNGPFQVGYSYWRARPDAPAAGTNDQRSDVLYGYYKFGGFKVGLAVNKSRLENSNTGTLAQERTAWSLPASYVFGPHNIVGHYTKAGTIRSNTVGATTENTGARMVALAYVYDLSKRTSVGLTYAQIRNDSNATYNFFTSASLGSLDTGIVAGEDARLLQATVRHAF